MSNTMKLSDTSRKLIDELRPLASNISLPQIAVVGDTSAGKSSVLTALSGFEFPSSSALCTRGPIELRLTQSSESKCSIHLEYPPDSKTAAEENKATKASFNSVAEASKALDGFIKQAVAGSETQFSNITVVISMEGPDQPNLTLIDLPGLVRTVSSTDKKTEQKVINFVRQLLIGFISQKRTVILACVASNVAVENQEVLKLAKDVDPDGLRTVALLTKPDCIGKGDERTAAKLLKNETYPVALGWASVKCRNTQALRSGETLKQAQESEERFFSTHETFKSLPNKDQICGSHALMIRLQQLLHERIQEQLPAVLEDIRKAVAQAEADVKAMGPELQDSTSRRMHFQHTIRRISQLIEQSGSSYDDKNGFFKDEKNRWMAAFRAKMESFAAEIHAVQWAPVSDESKHEQSKTKEKKKLHPDQERFIKVREDSRKYRGAELPGFPSFSLFSQLFCDYVLSQWKSPTYTLFENVVADGSRVVLATVREATGKSRHPRLQAYINLQVDAVLSDRRKIVKESLDERLQFERYPSTQNHYFFETVQKLRVAPLEQKLRKFADESGNLNIDTVLALLKQQMQKSNEDHEAEQVCMMLQAYTKLAAKRFIDHVEQVLCSSYISKISIEVESKLAPTDRQLEDMFASSPQEKTRREHLTNKLENLRKAMQKISQYR